MALAVASRRRDPGLAEDVLQVFKKARWGSAPLVSRKRAWVSDDEEEEHTGGRKRHLNEEIAVGVARALDELVGLDVHEKVVEARVEERVEAQLDELEQRMIPELQQLEARTAEKELEALVKEQERRIEELQGELEASRADRLAALHRAFETEQAYDLAMRAWKRDVDEFNASCARQVALSFAAIRSFA